MVSGALFGMVRFFLGWQSCRDGRLWWLRLVDELQCSSGLHGRGWQLSHVVRLCAADAVCSFNGCLTLVVRGDCGSWFACEAGLICASWHSSFRGSVYCQRCRGMACAH